MHDNLEIITDNKPRLILDWYEIPESVWNEEFDYLDEEERVGRDFIKYRGEYYDLGDFMRIESKDCMNAEMKKWDGYAGDSFFSGTLVKYCKDDTDRVIMGRYFS